MPSDADDALLRLRFASAELAAMAAIISGLYFHPFKRKQLMTLKDEILADVEEAKNRVRGEKDVEAALRADAEAKQAQIQSLEDRISQMEKETGAWTDADLKEIKDAVHTLVTAFDPDTTVDNVLANTPTDGGSPGGAVGDGE